MQLNHVESDRPTASPFGCVQADRRVINERAGQRGMKASTYLAALVRAHIATNPPLTNEELGAYKHGVVLLAGLGRLLARLSRDTVRAGSIPHDLQQELSRTRAVVAGLEKRTHDLGAGGAHELGEWI